VSTIKFCPICGNQGIVFSISSRKKNISYLELCQCVLEECECDGQAPYLIYNQETQKLDECHCRYHRVKLEQLNQSFNSSDIPFKYRHRRLSEFDVSSNEPDVSEELNIALDNAHHFIMQYDEYEKNADPPKGLFYFGPTGTGKTMLSCLILNELIYQYQANVQYVNITRGFFNKLKATFNTASKNYGNADKIFQEFVEKDVLVIDDFGVQADSSWEQTTLYDLLDSRYENEKPTIITSNYSPEEFKDLSNGRIFSRLQEMTIFNKLTIDDYREKFRVDS